MSSRTTARSCGAGSHIKDGREAMAVTDEENHSVLAGLQPFEWSDEQKTADRRPLIVDRDRPTN